MVAPRLCLKSEWLDQPGMLHTMKQDRRHKAALRSMSPFGVGVGRLDDAVQ